MISYRVDCEASRDNIRNSLSIPNSTMPFYDVKLLSLDINLYNSNSMDFHLHLGQLYTLSSLTPCFSLSGFYFSLYVDQLFIIEKLIICMYFTVIGSLIGFQAAGRE